MATFRKIQEKRQVALMNTEVFDNDPGRGVFRGREREFVLQDGMHNLYGPIREDALKYFSDNEISWWDTSTPTGHTLSSQIACLNHLFPIRHDKEAVLALLNGVRDEFEDVLPVPCDAQPAESSRSAYISFEVVSDKDHLKEGKPKRGMNCTSVDAFIYAVHRGDHKKWLIPIEWKYTESYEKTPKERAHQESVKRYVDLANLKSSNLKEWILDYEWNPLYEFARQELLMERIIAKKPLCGFGNKKKALEANDFIHVVVRPNENAEIIEDIAAFRKTIVEKSKFIEVDPQTLLAPLQQFEEYSDLLTYLQTRYWKK